MTSYVRVLLVSVVAGIVLGVGDLVWMTHVPFPLGEVANSSAVWAVSAFVLAAVLRLDPVRGALAGVVMLLVAVEAYYGAAIALDQASMATLTSSNTQMWLFFALVSGPAFGVAGAWAVGSSWLRSVIGWALAAGVLVGEGALRLVHLDTAELYYRSELRQLGWITILLGGLVLLAGARRPLRLLGAAALTVPVAVLCAAGFVHAGFGI